VGVKEGREESKASSVVLKGGGSRGGSGGGGAERAFSLALSLFLMRMTDQGSKESAICKVT
jgi:hypothetical protein